MSDTAVMIDGEIDALERSIAAHIAAGADAIDAALEQYRLAGVQLSHLRDLVDPGQWRRSLIQIGIDTNFARRCIRLATYWDVLPEAAKVPSLTKAGIAKPPTLTSALAHVAGQPATFPVGPGSKAIPNAKAIAKQMKADGCTSYEITSAVGVSWETVVRWLNPERARRSDAAKRERIRNQRIVERAKLKESAADDDLAKAYEHIRKALVILDAAARSASSPAYKELASSAYDKATSCEAAIVAALRLGRWSR